MTRIINSSADYSASSDWASPVSGLEYANIFTSGDLSRNLINGKNAASVIGSVSRASEGYAEFSGANGCLQLDAGETESMTYFTLCRCNPAQFSQTVIMGSYTNATTAAVSIYTTASTQVSYNYGATAGGNTSLVGANSPEDATAWGIRVLRINAGTIRYDNLTGDLTQQGVVANRALGSARIRVGGGYHPAFIGRNHQIMAALAHRWLTDEEVAKLASVARYSASKIGIAA